MLKQKFAHIYNVLPAIVLLGGVFTGFLANCFYSNEFLLDNRSLKTKPTTFSRDFSRQYEDYFNDTFAGRKRLIKKYGKIQYALGMDSGYTINGLNGWSFYDSAKVPDGYTLIDYYGAVHFNENELKTIVSGMKRAKDFYASRGIDYMVIVAPNKEGLYSEFMPERMQRERVSDVSRTDAAIEYVQANSDVRIINFREALEKAKKNLPYEVYFFKDSHWNEIGAYVAYAEMGQQLKGIGYEIDVPALTADMITQRGEHVSDLGVWLDKDRNFDVPYKQDIEIINEKDDDNGFFQVWRNPRAANKKTCLMIRDSFGVPLIRLLSRDFERCVFVHNKWNTREGLEKLIAEYKPDLVIDELVERYFNRFLKYNELYGEKK